MWKLLCKNKICKSNSNIGIEFLPQVHELQKFSFRRHFIYLKIQGPLSNFKS